MGVEVRDTITGRQDSGVDAAGWRIHRDSFLFDARTGHFFAITPEGVSILRDLAAGLDCVGIKEDLVARYGIDHGSAMRDIEHFRGRLRRLGIARSATLG